jgi:hypothetical protein
MPRSVQRLLPLVIALFLGGCLHDPHIAKPQLLEPGSDQLQRQRAQQFDPYPDTNIGPSVTGGRPDGYTVPMPEPVRGTANNRWAMTPFVR